MELYRPITAKAARVNAGISMKSASEHLGISRATLNSYESGRTSPPLEIVEKMSELYEIPTSGFLFARQSTKRGYGGTMTEQYIQVGTHAFRAPDGSFLPAVPLYIKATPEAKAAEQALIQDIGGVLAERMKQYIKETRKATKKGKTDET